MTNIEIRINGAAAVKGKQDGLLTAGMAGATVGFSFDGLWDGLSKTAVFKCGGMVRDVIGVEDTARIPPEVLCPDTELYVGVEGRGVDGAVVIPTVWVRAAYVYPGANASGDPSTDPTLPVWAQIQAMIGELAKLHTADKSSLVAAVNELVATVGSAVDEETIARLVDEYLAAHPAEPGTPGMGGGYYTPNVMQSADGEATIGWEASREGMPTVESVTVTLPKGIDGKDGIDGINGKNGIDGKDGEDYVLTNEDKQEIAEMAAELVEVPDSGGNVDLSGYAQKSELPTKVSQLQNDTGYLTAVPDGYAKTSEIPQKPEDIGAQPSGNYALKSEIPSVPVKSVNGKTGAVSLSASDVGARPSTWMPSASDVGALPSTTVIPTVPTKLSAFTNDSGFITGYTETDPTVPAWAKQSTKPSYSKSEVGLGNVDNVKQYSANNPPPYPVTSVNGKTGEVSLSIPTVPTKVSAFENDKGYLTQHQDISGKLDASALPTAINTALEQAKTSGEFDGADGKDGKDGINGKDGSDGKDGKDGVYTGDSAGIQQYLYDLAKAGISVARFEGTYTISEKTYIPAGMTIQGGTFVSDGEVWMFSAQGDNVRLVNVTLKADRTDRRPDIYEGNSYNGTGTCSNVVGFFSEGHDGVGLIHCVCDGIIPVKFNNGSGVIHGCTVNNAPMFVWGTNVRLTASDNHVSIGDTGLDKYYHVYYLDKDSTLTALHNRIRCDTAVAFADVYHLMTAGNLGTYRAKGIVDGDIVVGNFQKIIDCHYADLILKNCHIRCTNSGGWNEFGNMAHSSFRYENCDLDFTGASAQYIDPSITSGYVFYDGCLVVRTSYLPKHSTFSNCRLDLNGTTAVSNLCNVVGCHIVMRMDAAQCVGVISSSDAKFDFIGNRVEFLHPNTSAYLFRYAGLDGFLCNNTFSGVKAGTKLWYNDKALGVTQNNYLKEVASQ